MSPTLSASKSGTKGLAGKRGSQEGPVGSVFTSDSAQISVPTFGRNNIELEFRPVLIKLWQDLSRNYRC